MAVDWSQPIRTAGGRPAILRDRQSWQDVVGDPRRRVEVCNFARPRSDSTTWLATEAGGVRGDGAPSDFDIVNA
jgi:hypothetical protein